jgi:hypothetical protein
MKKFISAAGRSVRPNTQLEDNKNYLTFRLSSQTKSSDWSSMPIQDMVKRAALKTFVEGSLEYVRIEGCNSMEKNNILYCTSEVEAA